MLQPQKGTFWEMGKKVEKYFCISWLLSTIFAFKLETNWATRVV